MFIPAIPGEARNTLCESTEAMIELGWKPKVDLKEWINKKLDLHA